MTEKTLHQRVMLRYNFSPILFWVLVLIMLVLSIVSFGLALPGFFVIWFIWYKMTPAIEIEEEKVEYQMATEAPTASTGLFSWVAMGTVGGTVLALPVVAIAIVAVIYGTKN